MLMGFDKQCAKAAHDVRNKPVQFDGYLLHFTQAFDGERYAIQTHGRRYLNAVWISVCADGLDPSV